MPKGISSSRKTLMKIAKAVETTMYPENVAVDPKFLKSIRPQFGKKVKYEKYIHHGGEVWVRSDLKGTHREHCLCMFCKKLNVEDRKKNCKIANAVFKNCVKYNLVTPMFECPEFDEKD